MNILVISPNMYPCMTGGVEIFNYYFVKSIAKKVNRVLVFSCCDCLVNEDNISNIIFKKRSFFGSFLLTDLYILLNIIRFKSQIDVVYVPYTSNSHLIYPILIANLLFKVPYVITIHGGGMHPWNPKVLHKLFFQRTEAIAAVSETIQTEYEMRSNRAIKVIPPLIPFKDSVYSKEILRKMHEFRNDDLIIMSLGSIKKIKGNDLLLAAFFNLGLDYIRKNNLKLLFVGDGQMRMELENKVKTEKMTEYVRFTGKVPYENVSQMYKLADIYVIPSFFEGTPISMLEAMFNGMPIIGTDVNGISNLITDNKSGLLFEKGNIGDLSEKIKCLVGDKYLSCALGESAKRYYFDCYTFETVILEHINLIESTIRK